MIRAKEYLGDSVYVTYDGNGLILTTENGLGPSNTIYIEPDVYGSLLAYVEAIKNARARMASEVDPVLLREGVEGHAGEDSCP